ncbi:hypothetical protein G6F59_014999 [Rhizopus arrhizus]|nr:hypothetical protein G6F59_014999 [Rhizopus arrhizus]
MHDDVERACFGQHVFDRRLAGRVRLYVQFDAAKVGMMYVCPLCDVGHAGCIAPACFAHRGVDDVAGKGQCLGGHQAEAGGCAGDEDSV